MGRISLGIDICDDLLSAVVVDGTGRDAKVVDCAFNFLDVSAEKDLAEELSLLLGKLREKKAGTCIAGISLSCLSLRNLSLPFTDEKKIEQILPFELEEQLLLPVEEQVVTTAPSVSDSSGTGLLAAAMEKNILSSYLAAFRSNGLEPEWICPSAYVLADRFCRAGHGEDTFFLLHSDLSSVKTVIVYKGEIVFLRCLAYPDTVFIDPVFRYEKDNSVSVTDIKTADNIINSLCESIHRSIDYFCFQSGLDIQPDYFMLAGPMQLCGPFKEKLKNKLGLPGRPGELMLDKTVPVATKHWRPALYDSALALALLAGRGRSTVALNFRKEEFAPPHYFLRSKKHMVTAGAAVGALILMIFVYLFVDYRQLQTKHDDLSAGMAQIFKKSFPSIDPGRDPLMHMRSRLKAMDTTTASSTPIFTEEKRILVILADISSRISQDIKLNVGRLIIDQNSVRMKGTTDAFNNVNEMQDVLSKSERYSEVNIVSATKGKGKEGIRFELRLQLGSGEDS